MKIRLGLLFSLSLCIVFFTFSQDQAKLSITTPSTGMVVIAVTPTFHTAYGLKYPMTYQIDIPSGSSSLKALEKHQILESTWIQLTEKTSVDTFNAVEAVRFDYTNSRVYVSAAFSGASDSLFLEIVDGANNPVSIVYRGISKYYDNRKAVVTATFDDWGDWMFNEEGALIHLFRSYGIYVTGGVITWSTSRPTWQKIQAELDSGFVEIASHSRTHIATPYDTIIGTQHYTSVSEVGGSVQDIKTALNFPPLFSLNGTKYVYTWIAPYGDYDSKVDSLLGGYGYLDARLYENGSTASPREYVYGDSILHPWDNSRNHFSAFFPTLELGAPSWGGGDTSLTSLNGLFDAILAKGDVYHFMWHPQVLYPDINKSYLINHLNHISGHTNVWYVNLGHLYLYNLVQSLDANQTTLVSASRGVPEDFELFQNYPNPFNPSTNITFNLKSKSDVKIEIFNVLGQRIKNVDLGLLNAGSASQTIDLSRYATGIYFYRLNVVSGDGERFTAMKKMILLK